RHAAAVMFPGAELTENAVVYHFGIVRGERSETTTRNRQLLRQLGIQAYGIKRADEGVERLHARAKYDQWFRIFPGHDDIVRPHAVGNVVAAECRGGG